jgi:hypothetical protein
MTHLQKIPVNQKNGAIVKVIGDGIQIKDITIVLKGKEACVNTKKHNYH